MDNKLNIGSYSGSKLKKKIRSKIHNVLEKISNFGMKRRAENKNRILRVIKIHATAKKVICLLPE